ncbi:serine hydrolase [Brassicibacter mesophilus]|uniref:serine hydrolase n=1 Tax=Brassicibacter mesophilus TaxID=745119 RepID=UPI003D255E2B
MLKDKIMNELHDTRAKVSIVLKDLTRNEWIIKIDENRRFPSASTIKVLIMIEALKQVQEDIFTLEHKVKVREIDRVDFSIITELNINEYTFKDLLTLMIITSDNTATNVLINLLGYENINHMARTLGLTNTVLKRKMMDFEAAKLGRQNETSAIDMAQIMESIYSKSILTPELCEIMIDILSRQKHNDMLPRYITEEIVIAHKPGELDRLNHDVGIFYLDNVHYMLGVFVTDVQHNLEAKRIIGRISKIVYDYYIEENM